MCMGSSPSKPEPPPPPPPPLAPMVSPEATTNANAVGNTASKRSATQGRKALRIDLGTPRGVSPGLNIPQ